MSAPAHEVETVRTWIAQRHAFIAWVVREGTRALHVNWQFWVALGSAAITVVTFYYQHESDLAWKRTEFVFTQVQFLETDPQLVAILGVLEKRDPRAHAADIVSKHSSLTPELRLQLSQSLDKYLDLFDRLAYGVYSAKTVSLKELSLFGWYLQLVHDDPSLYVYCDTHGFRRVLRLARDEHAYALRGL